LIVLGEWELTAWRVAIHRPTGTAVVADLHLGYTVARRRAGEAVPEVPLDVELAPLRAASVATGVRRLVVAGDLLEDGRHRDVLEGFLCWLRAARIELGGFVPGNHDRPDWLPCDEGVLPVRPAGVRVGEWLIVHGHQSRPAGRVVQGHEHPRLRLPGGPDTPCFLVTESHLILPAYSQEAAGTNVLSSRRLRDYRCFVPAGEAVLDFGPLGTMRRRLGENGGRPGAGGRQIPRPAPGRRRGG
jgi:metallophosphoesterase superfamily enzyme